MKNWTQWNVGLWLNNDEPLYRLMQSFLRKSGGNKDLAASAMFTALTDATHGMGITHTPDGAKYSFSNIRAAMRDL